MIIYLIIGLAIVSRFIPHIPNFAPITAVAIFSAAYLPWKKAAGITFAARFVSDAFLGFFSWPLMAAVYLSHLVGILFGVWIKQTTPSASGNHPSLTGGEAPRNNRGASPPNLGGVPSEAGGGGIHRWFKIILSSLGASAIFFLATNFAFLYSNYPHNFSGIIQAYINGLPFLRGTLMGDMFYSVALFGGYEAVRFIVRAKSRAVFN